jgi:hypothetical protein
MHREWDAAMTSKTEEYQAKARECEQQAKESTRGLQKQVYAEFARQWREMAEQVEAPRPQGISRQLALSRLDETVLRLINNGVTRPAI